MQIASLLTPQRTQVNTPGSNQKRVLEHLSLFIAEDIAENIHPDDIFDALIEREKLGTTGIGQGIAIPHCRMDGLQQAYGSFFKLEQAIDFDAVDDQAVDLLFVLLVPPDACDQHLQTLASLAQAFSQTQTCERLRNSKTALDLYNNLINITD